MKQKKINLFDMIIAYESGDLTAEDILKLFAELIRTGWAYSLQGHYGKVATGLIRQGYIDKEGNILKELGG